MEKNMTKEEFGTKELKLIKAGDILNVRCNDADDVQRIRSTVHQFCTLYADDMKWKRIQALTVNKKDDLVVTIETIFYPHS